MRSKILSAFVISVSLLTLNACSIRTEESDRLVDRIDHDTHSCDFKSMQGETAKMDMLAKVDLKLATFDKEYNSSLLEGVLKANVASTIDYIKNSGLSLYKASLISTKSCSSALFASLSVMPKDIADEFNGHERAANKKKSVILGMYFPKDSSRLSGLPSTVSKPALIVRENTNRWTLMHEFGHHLFKTRELETGNDSLVQAEKMYALQKKADAIRVNSATTQEAKLELLAPLFDEYAAAVTNVTVSYPLEEVAIEVLLKNAYAKGSLKYAPLNSDSYIISSLQKAAEMINDAMEFGLNILEPAAKQKNTAIYDRVLIPVEKLSALHKVISDMHEKYEKKNERLKNIGKDAGLASSEDSVNEEAETTQVDCGHDKILDSVIAGSKKLKDFKF